MKSAATRMKSAARRAVGSACTARRDLAMEYFPDVAPRMAVQRLRRWINSDPTLLGELCAEGYRGRQRFLPAAQVRVLRKYMG